MKKRNKLFFVIVALLGLAAVLLFYRKDESNYYSSRVISKNILGKLHLYDLIIDSTERGSYIKNLNLFVGMLNEIKGQIEVVGERMNFSKDSMEIEWFIFSKNGKVSSIDIFNCIDDSITRKTFNVKYLVPDFPNFCDEHYFYFSDRNEYGGKHNAYSLSVIQKDYRDFKVFISKKFDEFNNTNSPCDETEINELLLYINKQLDDRPGPH